MIIIIDFYLNIIVLILIAFLIIKIQNFKESKNVFQILCSKSNPSRELYTHSAIKDIYKNTYINYFEDKTMSIENFHILFESCVAELILYFLNEKNLTQDIYLKNKYYIKALMLFKTYKNNYILNCNTINGSLIQRIVNIISEVNINIYNIYNDLERIFYKENESGYIFRNYIVNDDKLFLNYESIEINHNFIKKYSKEIYNEDISYSKLC
jgi:hypothetical protein